MTNSDNKALWELTVRWLITIQQEPIPLMHAIVDSILPASGHRLCHFDVYLRQVISATFTYFGTQCPPERECYILGLKLLEMDGGSDAYDSWRYEYEQMSDVHILRSVTIALVDRFVAYQRAQTINAYLVRQLQSLTWKDRIALIIWLQVMYCSVLPQSFVSVPAYVLADNVSEIALHIAQIDAQHFAGHSLPIER